MIRRGKCHGCINLPLPVAEFLYGWAPLGTPVTVTWTEGTRGESSFPKHRPVAQLTGTELRP